MTPFGKLWERRVHEHFLVNDVWHFIFWRARIGSPEHAQQDASIRMEACWREDLQEWEQGKAGGGVQRTPQMEAQGATERRAGAIWFSPHRMLLPSSSLPSLISFISTFQYCVHLCLCNNPNQCWVHWPLSQQGHSPITPTPLWEASLLFLTPPLTCPVHSLHGILGQGQLLFNPYKQLQLDERLGIPNFVPYNSKANIPTQHFMPKVLNWKGQHWTANFFPTSTEYNSTPLWPEKCQFALLNLKENLEEEDKNLKRRRYYWQLVFLIWGLTFTWGDSLLTL